MTLYDLSAKLNNGRNKKLADYKGKVLLIVNTASQCGFTPQYEGLQSLYSKHKERGFEVLGFPCDQFGHQEPGSDDEIKSVLPNQLRGELSPLLQDRGQRRGHASRLQISEEQERRFARRQHQVELHKVLGGQEGKCRRTICSHDAAHGHRIAN